MFTVSYFARYKRSTLIEIETRCILNMNELKIKLLEFEWTYTYSDVIKSVGTNRCVWNKLKYTIIRLVISNSLGGSVLLCTGQLCRIYQGRS